MLAVTLVLLLIMGTINITNYESTKQSAEQLLNILADNEGVFHNRRSRLTIIHRQSPRHQQTIPLCQPMSLRIKKIPFPRKRPLIPDISP